MWVFFGRTPISLKFTFSKKNCAAHSLKQAPTAHSRKLAGEPFSYPEMSQIVSASLFTIGNWANVSMHSVKVKPIFGEIGIWHSLSGRNGGRGRLKKIGIWRTHRTPTHTHAPPSHTHRHAQAINVILDSIFQSKMYEILTFHSIRRSKL